MSLRRAMRKYKLGLARGARALDTRSGKRKAVWHFMLFDHGILRTFWFNFAEIAPGVFRANQPSPERLVRYARRGIKTIVNLRGPSHDPHYLLEKKSCENMELALVDVAGLKARVAPDATVLLRMLDSLRNAEKPLVFHCKSGADRTSLAAATYLLADCGASVAQARKQFSPRFIHFKWTKTGVLDLVLDTYETAYETTGIGFEDWLKTEYDAAAVQAAFNASRA